MSIIHAPEETALDFRQLLIPGVIFIFLGIYFVRLWFLQVVVSQELQDEANRTGEISVAVLAPRGQIVDREKRVLAGIEPRWVVTAVPREVKQNPKGVGYVADLLQVDDKLIKKKLADAEAAPDLPAVIYIGATNQQATRIAESDKVRGFGVDMRTLRTVKDPRSLSHLLGYVGRPNATEEERIKEMGRTPAQYVGRDGIEREYEEDLMGTEGKERMIVDARRRPVRRLPGEAPLPGTSLELSLDIDVQRLAAKLLLRDDGKGRGAVVALDPRNGEIIAMASAPTYNLGDFEGGISQEQYAAYMNDKGTPFLKRAIAGQYSPGSTFKIVNAISAAIKGKLDLNHYVHCAGGTKIGNRFIECKNHAAGSLKFYEAMTKSCNSYFIDLALKQEGGPLGDTSHEVGLGRLTGIDIPGESEAFCPTTPWINEQRAKQNWFKGHTANMGIGQGELRVTPIQMAQIAALVGNRGVAYKPHIVRAKLLPGEGNPRQPVEPVVAIKLEADPDFWTTLRQAMINVINEGTAKGARISGVEWAGKTGSTENTGSRTHAWFVGFAPAENPRIAIAVLVENAGHGGDISAPIARQIVKLWLDKLDHKVLSSTSSPERAASSAETASVAN